MLPQRQTLPACVNTSGNPRMYTRPHASQVVHDMYRPHHLATSTEDRPKHPAAATRRLICSSHCKARPPPHHRSHLIYLRGSSDVHLALFTTPTNPPPHPTPFHFPHATRVDHTVVVQATTLRPQRKHDDEQTSTTTTTPQNRTNNKKDILHVPSPPCALPSSIALSHSTKLLIKSYKPPLDERLAALLLRLATPLYPTRS